MRLTVEMVCRECEGHGAFSTHGGGNPRARHYGCEECGGMGRWEVSGEIVPEREPGQGFDGLELINFDCPRWLSRSERSDAEEALWIRFQEREAA